MNLTFYGRGCEFSKLNPGKIQKKNKFNVLGMCM
jgi:hypothetical protein